MVKGRVVAEVFKNIGSFISNIGGSSEVASYHHHPELHSVWEANQRNWQESRQHAKAIPKWHYGVRPVEDLPDLKGKRICNIVLTHNFGGPCPLIAVANVLIFRGEYSFQKGDNSIPDNDFIQFMHRYLLKKNESGSINIDVKAQIDKMDAFKREGLDADPSYIDAFGFGTEVDTLGFFKMFNITLCHCWVMGDDNPAFDALKSFGETRDQFTFVIS